MTEINKEKVLDLLDRLKKEIKTEKSSKNFLKTDIVSSIFFAYSIITFVVLMIFAKDLKETYLVPTFILLVFTIISITVFPAFYLSKRITTLEDFDALLEDVEAIRNMVEHPETSECYYFDGEDDMEEHSLICYYKEKFREKYPSKEDDQTFKDLLRYVSDMIFESDKKEKEKREEFLKNYV